MDVPTIFRHPLALGREGGNWEREERQVMREDKSFMAVLVVVVVRHSHYILRRRERVIFVHELSEIESRGARVYHNSPSSTDSSPMTSHKYVSGNRLAPLSKQLTRMHLLASPGPQIWMSLKAP